MKKFILFLFFMPFAIVGKAQTLTESDLAKIDIKAYDSGFNGRNYNKAASVIAKDYPPDKDGNLTRIFIVENINKTKEQIYIATNNWFISSFNDANSVIQLNDKEAGTIIGVGIEPKVESSWTGSYTDSRILIRVDIKDNRVRIITQIQEYDVFFPASNYAPSHRVKWKPIECYPFAETNNIKKKSDSKALVNSHIACLGMISRLRDAIIGSSTNTIEATDNW